MIHPEAAKEHNEWVDELIESIEGESGEAMFQPLRDFLERFKFPLPLEDQEA